VLGDCAWRLLGDWSSVRCLGRGLSSAAQYFSDERSQFRVGHLVSWCPRRFQHVESELPGNLGRRHFGCRWGSSVVTLDCSDFAESVASRCIALRVVGGWQSCGLRGRCLLTRGHDTMAAQETGASNRRFVFVFKGM
jgi:hypothetical protein